jgi:hypothetical protein
MQVAFTSRPIYNAASKPSVTSASKQGRAASQESLHFGADRSRRERADAGKEFAKKWGPHALGFVSILGIIFGLGHNADTAGETTTEAGDKIVTEASQLIGAIGTGAREEFESVVDDVTSKKGLMFELPIGAGAAGLYTSYRVLKGRRQNDDE